MEIAELLVKKTCQAAKGEAAAVNKEAGGLVCYPQGDNLTVIVTDLPPL